MLAINSYYLNSRRTLISQPRVVVFDGSSGAAGAAAAPVRSPTTRRRFVDLAVADCEAVRLGLFACCRDFLVVAASFSCCFRARAAASSLAFAAASFFASCRIAFACSAIFFLYDVAAAFGSPVSVF
jgi:hypothetical protein